jgi:3',5'-cyclic AMP phosphodiesterase CpdA
MLTVAQITDLHITSDKAPLDKARNEARLRTVLKAIHARRPRPVAIIASGDLVDRGEAEEYAELKKILAEVEIPLYLGLGNHDLRAPFRAAFPQTPVDKNGFVQYTADLGGVRLVMLDTLEEGSNDAGFCKKRAAWLKRALREDRRTPTIVALHHPPIISGIQWMDPPPDADWIKRLAKVIKGRDQVRTLISGHLHRAFHGVLAGQVASVSPATSIQLTLDLTPVDMRVPDGREILLEEPPGYSLYMWDKGQFITHVCVAGDFPSAVTYDVPFEKGSA